MTGVLVLAEHRGGALCDVTLEMLGLARALGDPTVLLIGGTTGLSETLATSRAHVLHAPTEGPGEYDAEPWLEATAHVVAARRPGLVLIGHTACGMETAPALAARLGAPIVTDCLGLSRSGETFVAVRHAHGGKVVERLTLRPAPCVVATVRPGMRPAAPAGAAGSVEQVVVPGGGRARRCLVRVVEAALAGVDITAADFLVSVGRGIGKPENVATIEAFAEAVGATLSCSRPVADKGWLPKSRQVGTSGRTVRPKVYLALGISGAYQHVAGMRGAGTIVAVNKDPAAPIFDVAHAGIVGDLFEVLPVLQDKLLS